MKHLAITVLSVFCLGIPTGISGQTAPNPHTPSPELQAEIAQAARSGKKTLVLPEPNNYLASGSNMDDVFDHSVIFVGTLARVQSDILQDLIETWAVFHIEEDLSRNPISTTVDPFQDSFQAILPNGILPLGSDEFLLHLSGGAVTIDGVKLVSGKIPHLLSIGGRYMLIASVAPSLDGGSVHLGRLWVGNQGIFRVEGDRRTLTPLIPVEGSVIQQSIRNDYISDLDRVRQKAVAR